MDPVVSHLADGEGDELSGIGGIGEDLLVARMASVEDDLANRLPLGADCRAFEYVAAGQRQRRLPRSLHFPSSWTGFPATNVLIAFPRKVHPEKGLLRDLE